MFWLNEKYNSHNFYANSYSVLYFRFCKIFRPGMFHCSLNKEILDMEQKMPELRNVDDQTSKAGLKTRAGIRNVTNVGTRTMNSIVSFQKLLVSAPSSRHGRSI